MTEAICLTHKVDISEISKKTLVQPFIDAIVSLEEAKTKKQRELEFKAIQGLIHIYTTLLPIIQE